MRLRVEDSLSMRHHQKPQVGKPNPNPVDKNTDSWIMLPHGGTQVLTMLLISQFSPTNINHQQIHDPTSK
ncbi:hypothetical protein F441_13452 [Phytophthora nicotianae CJ01A1]|uniref:Uncharacterized protein n=3 Tax=Phytophthora nicotianae TaxID=4792 RepID=V9ET42_PHYNI|nr:hypothetical protein F443_13519 [Phytophthora nicotianae P1569]ETK81286.1 hypothetical protein L915_13202 [Phytophthora nicotianae]ETP11008.1 hypothetical protein F441_13452 [Phytophthora nicotianae CJ01A1]